MNSLLGVVCKVGRFKKCKTLFKSGRACTYICTLLIPHAVNPVHNGNWPPSTSSRTGQDMYLHHLSQLASEAPLVCEVIVANYETQRTSMCTQNLWQKGFP
jgi:hypothetical protein